MGAGAIAMSTSAQSYMAMAHSSNLFEIQSSQLALQSSRNQTVRTFAQMMINDHTRMMQEMMPVHGKPSMGMLPEHAAMMQRLRTAPAGSFDRTYHQEQTMAHQQALNLHQSYASNGDNQMLRAMAARAVPVIQMHLNELKTHQMHMMM